MKKLNISEVTSKVEKRILNFLNESTSIKDIQSSFLTDSPFSGKGDQINDYVIGKKVAENLLKYRNSLPNKRFRSIEELNHISGFGQDKLNDLIYNFSAFHSVKLKKLENKGVNIRFEIYDDKSWEELTSQNKEIPTTFKQLRQLGKKLFKKSDFLPLKFKSVSSGLLKSAYEECGESSLHNYFLGLGNPNLSMRQRAMLESDLDTDTPTFENSIETDHFILKWTNESDHENDNIEDESIIEETSMYLEEAWDKYSSEFGRTPYIASGRTKIEVIFQDIRGYGVASPPDGPIQFDAKNWIDKPGIRKPTSAHELFHKLQYAFGYRTTHSPSGDYKWFSEGAASWSEVFVWQRVSGDYKILDLFSNPDIDLYSSSYRALPFWMFFEKRQKESASDNPVVDFLNKYEISGDERSALEEVISESWASNNVYRTLDNFYALFSRDRRIGSWKRGMHGGYRDILGPGNNVLNPELGMLEVELDFGDTYSNSNTVEKMGADYFYYKLNPSTDEKTFNMEGAVVGSGEISYYLIFEKDNAFKRAIFPFGANGSYSFSEIIDISQIDGVVVIVSSRGERSRYSIEINIS